MRLDSLRGHDGTCKQPSVETYNRTLRQKAIIGQPITPIGSTLTDEPALIGDDNS